MSVQTPIRMTAAEETLVKQLENAGATDVAARIRDKGLPTRRVEAYHYTDLRNLLNAVPALAEPATDAGVSPVILDEAFTITIINGVLQPSPKAPQGVTISVVEGSVLNDRDDAIANIHSGLIANSVEIQISGDIAEPIFVNHRVVGDAGHVQAGVKCVVANGSSVTIVEAVSGVDAAHLVNTASVVIAGDNTKVTHILLDILPAAARNFSTSDYVIGADSEFKSVTMNIGAGLSRARINALVNGENTTGSFNGLNAVDGEELRDITLEVTHAVPNTDSTETFKQIARGRGRAVFQGKINVAMDAQKTDAKMMMQGLLLSDEAEILAKPELEIFADDVVCGHGATCGDLDDTWMFYLMSRGISRAHAEQMLIRAFIQEVIDVVENEAMAAVLTTLIDQWLHKSA